MAEEDSRHTPTKPALEEELVQLVHSLRRSRQQRASRRASRGHTTPASSPALHSPQSTSSDKEAAESTARTAGEERRSEPASPLRLRTTAMQPDRDTREQSCRGITLPSSSLLHAGAHCELEDGFSLQPTHPREASSCLHAAQLRHGSTARPASGTSPSEAFHASPEPLRSIGSHVSSRMVHSGRAPIQTPSTTHISSPLARRPRPPIYTQGAQRYPTWAVGLTYGSLGHTSDGQFGSVGRASARASTAPSSMLMPTACSSRPTSPVKLRSPKRPKILPESPSRAGLGASRMPSSTTAASGTACQAAATQVRRSRPLESRRLLDGSTESENEGGGEDSNDEIALMLPQLRRHLLRINLSQWYSMRARHPRSRLLQHARHADCRRAMRAWDEFTSKARRIVAARLDEVAQWRLSALLGKHSREPMECGRSSLRRWTQPMLLRTLHSWRVAAHESAIALREAEEGAWRRRAMVKGCTALRASLTRATFRQEASRHAVLHLGCVRWHSNAKRAAALAAAWRMVPPVHVLAGTKCRAAIQQWLYRSGEMNAMRRKVERAISTAAVRALTSYVVSWRVATARTTATQATTRSFLRSLLPSHFHRWARRVVNHSAAFSTYSRSLRRRSLMRLKSACVDIQLMRAHKVAIAAATASFGRSRASRALKAWTARTSMAGLALTCSEAARRSSILAALEKWQCWATVSAAAEAVEMSAAAASWRYLCRTAIHSWCTFANSAIDHAMVISTGRAHREHALMASGLAMWYRGAAAIRRRHATLGIRLRLSVTWRMWLRVIARWRGALARQERGARKWRGTTLRRWHSRAAVSAASASKSHRAKAHWKRNAVQHASNTMRRCAAQSVASRWAGAEVAHAAQRRALGMVWRELTLCGAMFAAERAACALWWRLTKGAKLRIWVVEHRRSLFLSRAVTRTRRRRASWAMASALRTWREQTATTLSRRRASIASQDRSPVFVRWLQRVESTEPEDLEKRYTAIVDSYRLSTLLRAWAAAVPDYRAAGALRDKVFTALSERRAARLHRGLSGLESFAEGRHDRRACWNRAQAHEQHRHLACWLAFATGMRVNARMQHMALGHRARVGWRIFRAAVHTEAARTRWDRVQMAHMRVCKMASSRALAHWLMCTHCDTEFIRALEAADHLRRALALRRVVKGIAVARVARGNADRAAHAWRSAALATAIDHWHDEANALAAVGSKLSRAPRFLGRRRLAFHRWQERYWWRLCKVAAIAHHAAASNRRVLGAWNEVVRSWASRRAMAAAKAERQSLVKWLKRWVGAVEDAKGARAEAEKVARVASEIAAEKARAASEKERWRASLPGGAMYLATPLSEPPLRAHTFLSGTAQGHSSAPSPFVPSAPGPFTSIVGTESLTHARALGRPTARNLPLGSAPAIGGIDVRLNGPPLSHIVDEHEIERAAQHAAAVERARRESNRARLEMLRAQALAEAALGVMSPSAPTGVAHLPVSSMSSRQSPHQLRPAAILPVAASTIHHSTSRPTCLDQERSVHSCLQMPPADSPTFKNGAAAASLERLLNEFRSFSAVPSMVCTSGSAVIAAQPPATAQACPRSPSASRAPAQRVEALAKSSPGPKALRLAAAAANRLATLGGLDTARVSSGVQGGQEGTESDLDNGDGVNGSCRAPVARRRLALPEASTSGRALATDYIDRVRRARQSNQA